MRLQGHQLHQVQLTGKLRDAGVIGQVRGKSLPFGFRPGDADRVTGIGEARRQLGKVICRPISGAAVRSGVEKDGRLSEGVKDALDRPVRLWSHQVLPGPEFPVHIDAERKEKPEAMPSFMSARRFPAVPAPVGGMSHAGPAATGGHPDGDPGCRGRAHHGGLGKGMNHGVIFASAEEVDTGWLPVQLGRPFDHMVHADGLMGDGACIAPHQHIHLDTGKLGLECVHERKGDHQIPQCIRAGDEHLGRCRRATVLHQSEAGMLPPGGPRTPARHGPSGGAVQESPLQNERFQPLGTDLQADEEEWRLEAAVKLILCPHLAEPLNLLKVVGGARIAVVLHISGDANDGHGAVEDGPLVDGALPMGRARGPEAEFPIRSPATVGHPPVDVARQAVNFSDPPGAIGRLEGTGHHLTDGFGGRRGQGLIGVEAEDPVPFRGRIGLVLRGRPPGPLTIDNPRSAGLRDVHGPVHTARIEHHDLVGQPFDGIQQARQVVRLVPRDHDNAEPVVFGRAGWIRSGFQCVRVSARIGEEWSRRVENMAATGPVAKVVLRCHARIDTWIRWTGARHRLENLQQFLARGPAFRTRKCGHVGIGHQCGPRPHGLLRCGGPRAGAPH